MCHWSLGSFVHTGHEKNPSYSQRGFQCKRWGTKSTVLCVKFTLWGFSNLHQAFLVLNSLFRLLSLHCSSTRKDCNFNLIEAPYYLRLKFKMDFCAYGHVWVLLAGIEISTWHTCQIEAKCCLWKVETSGQRSPWQIGFSYFKKQKRIIALV